MDFTKPLTFAGLSINTVSRTAGGAAMSGYLVEEFDPSVIDVAAFLSKRALQDGLDASDVYLGGRNIGLVVTVFGSTIGDFWDKSQDLFAAFSPTLSLSADTANLGFRALTFYQPTADISTWPTSAYPDGIPLQYYVRPVAPPRYVQRRDEEGGAANNGLSKQYRIALLARDPRKYSQSESSLTLSLSSQSATNSGDYPTFPTITINSNTVTSQTVVLQIGSSSLSVSIDAASTTYVIDCAANVITKNGTVNMGLVVGGDLDLRLDPGATVARRLSASGPTCTLAWRHAFA